MIRDPMICKCGRRKHQWEPTMHPVCVECDRIKCPKCQRPIVDGFATRCPACKAFVGWSKGEVA